MERIVLNIIKSRIAILLLAVVMSAPVLSYAQSDEEAEPATESASGTGPWGNSAASSVGSRSSSATTEASATDPRLNPGALARPAGATPDATGGPGGNPDVPFDAGMNLMFLAGGLVFAYVVYRRRFKLKPVAAAQK